MSDTCLYNKKWSFAKEMQARTINEAAMNLMKKGIKTHPKIKIPLTCALT